jgi:hypothetical protein
MPINESAVQIKVETAAAQQSTTSIRTFRVLNPLTGLPVEVQGVVLCDDSGEPYYPMTEETGREIVSLLQSINDTLGQAYGLVTHIT